MPEYLSPGVYIEEIATGPRPIEGVSTSTTGFVGLTERGPMTPRLVTSWLQFQRLYGGHISITDSYLPYAVQGFFDNGGQRAWITRATRQNASRARDANGVPQTLLTLATAGGAQTLLVVPLGDGGAASRIFVRVTRGSRAPRPSSNDLPSFRLTLLYYRVPPPQPFVDPLNAANALNPDRREPDMAEDYDNLVNLPESGDYVLTRINGSSNLVEVEWGQALTPGDPQELPTDTPGPFGPLDGLATDGTTALTADRFTGVDPGGAFIPPNRRTGLAALELIDAISILSVPDEVNELAVPQLADRAAITSAIIGQCETLRDRFAVLQVPGNLSNVQDVLTNARQPLDTSYAALYYPWVRVLNPFTRETILVPPGGHVCGIYARTDVERGVHKAPANADVRGIISRDLEGDKRPLEFQISKRDHDALNPAGVNVIRDFRSDNRGIRVWGARTVSSDTLWKYVNVRRLFLFVEESIDEGTQWVVFEPNDEPLWASVRLTITNFLTTVWRSGALMGTTQEEAFFVKCDRTTMTEDDINNGRLICYIGMAPVRPAEFVIFRFSQKTLEPVA